MMEGIQNSLGTKLRLLRARAGITQEVAAERIGITQESLSQLERNRRQPYMPTLVKLAEGYGVPVEELLVEQEEPAPPKTESRQDRKHLPSRREEAAFVIVGRIIDEQLTMAVLWNVLPEERDQYRPALHTMLPEGFIEDELPEGARELVGSAS
jgi:transcriptional regulator with XRE-family HTH domain